MKWVVLAGKVPRMHFGPCQSKLLFNRHITFYFSASGGV